MNVPCNIDHWFSLAAQPCAVPLVPISSLLFRISQRNKRKGVYQFIFYYF